MKKKRTNNRINSSDKEGYSLERIDMYNIKSSEVVASYKS